MTGVEKILERIVNDAKAQAEAKLAEAEKKAKDIIDQGDEQAANDLEMALVAAKAEAEDLIKRREAVCDLELRKEQLAVKRRIIDEAFLQAEKDVLSISDADYTRLMSDLLLECISVAEGEVIVSKRDGNGMPGYVKLAEIRLAEEGRPRDIKIARMDKSILGGFIYSANGMEINCSLIAVVRQKREALESGVYGLLFES